MAGFLTHLMEGQNISELNQMAVDGDPKHLGVVGRNLTIININERARMEAELAGLANRPVEPVRDPELDRQQYMAERQRDREEAMRRTGFKALPKAQRIAAMPDSDEAVDSFLKDLY